VLLALPAVSGNTEFDTESKWLYIVLQYINDETGEKFTSRHRKVGADWDEPYFFFPSTISLGSLRKRAIIIVAKTGAELALLPATFTEGERIRILA
jgi:hypothetical protein